MDTGNHYEVTRGKAACILVVDSDETNLAVMSRRLTKLGHAVTTASGGKEALEIIDGGGVDLVLLELAIPNISGKEVLAKIRDDQSPSALPVIIVTAKQTSEVLVDAFTIGANDYVTKPIDDAVLAARIQAQISGKRAHETVQEAQNELEKRVRERTADLQLLNETLRHEINERKQIQQQLIQSSKLATLGEMATAVAHELNQPLSVIRMSAEGALELIMDGDVDPDYLKGKLEKIATQTERAGATIDHMRIFGRLDATESERFNPVDAVTGALKLMSEVLRLRDIEVVTDFPEKCPHVLGYPMQLEQVFLNLLGNARDAIGDRVQAKGNAGDAPPKRITIKVEGDPTGKPVRIFFEDTGGGIADDHIDRLFEPFYTTKEVGKGTGLGLSISYGIVTDMGGILEVENGDEGARFTILLPVVPEERVDERTSGETEPKQDAVAS